MKVLEAKDHSSASSSWRRRDPSPNLSFSRFFHTRAPNPILVSPQPPPHKPFTPFLLDPHSRCNPPSPPPLSAAAATPPPSSLSPAASSSHCLILAADHGSAMDGVTSSPSQAALADERTRMSSSWWKVTRAWE
ncbi:hypothetical protein VPH35_117016 [Triticum aestivum]